MKTSTRNRWVISDPHFFHKQIIKYENRPWDCVDEMNKGIRNRWNSVVKNGDLVYCLGDITFANKETTKPLIEQLNGEIHLVLGNHDRGKSHSWFKDLGFHFVSPYPIIIDGFVILSHEPVYLNENMPYRNIHGHTHGTNYGSPEMYFNASVEKINYTPIKLDIVYQQLKDKI